MKKRKPNGYWTLERCKRDAAKYSTRADWARGNKSAKTAAERSGWLGECCAHMNLLVDHGKWTKSACIESARKFSTRDEWRRGESGAWTAASRNGWWSECTEHMDRTGGSDNDVVYVWRDEVTGLHKIGITSARLGEFRIGGFNKGVDPSIVFMLKVNDARAVESKLLELGTDPRLDSSIDGYTEFRRLTDAELGKAVSIAYEAALAA